MSARSTVTPPSPALMINVSKPAPPVSLSEPVPPSRIFAPALPINVSLPPPPDRESSPVPAPPLSLAYSVSFPLPPNKISVPPRPVSTLSPLSPWSVSLAVEPLRFSKFTAPPVVKVSVWPLVMVLASKSKVSTPAPPSSFAGLKVLTLLT